MNATGTAVTQTIRDTFHSLALRAGLTHTGGHGAYSEFTGTRDQWVKLRSLVHHNAAVYHPSALRAALSRIEWACS